MCLLQRCLALAVFCLLFVTAAEAACKPAGDVLFQDQFDTLAQSWGSFENYHVEGGRLVIQPPADHNTAAINGASLYDDVDVCVEMTVPAPVTKHNCGGIIFWAIDYDNYYSLQVSTDGQAAVWRRQKAKWLNPVPWQDFASVRKSADEVNELRVTTAGDKARLYVNGTLFMEVSGQPPKDGSQIGLLACSPTNASAHVEFDNFIASEPAAAPAASPEAKAEIGSGRVKTGAGCQPSGEALFSDTFDTLAPSWGTFENYKVDNGEFLITPPAGYNTAALNAASLYDDVDLCVEMRARAPVAQGTCGALIIWGADYDNYYSFQVSTDGQASFWRRQRGKWLSQVPWQAAGGINAGDSVNQLRVTTSGRTARLFINGKLFTEVQGEPPAKGQEIGLLACSGKTLASAVGFDNLVVSAAGASGAEPKVADQESDAKKAAPAAKPVPRLAQGAVIAGGRRVALVIGIGNYRSVPALPAPLNDAADIAAELQGMGFDVTHLDDLDAAAMRQALRGFAVKADGASMALVYFSGHAMQVDGLNYLMPVDAALDHDTNLDDDAVSLKRVFSAVDGARDLRLVLLDACRDSPFLAKAMQSGDRMLSRGLARIIPLSSMLVAFSAKDGTTAGDGNGRNSPFTSALLANLKTPGLEVSDLFRRVRDEVMTATKNRQEPFVFASLNPTPIYLAGP